MTGWASAGLFFGGRVTAPSGRRPDGRDEARHAGPPDARDPTRDWTEVLLAAALQGAIFALVRAAVDRAGAAGVGHAVGDWPTRDRKPSRVTVPV